MNCKNEINAIYLLVSMVVAGIFPFLAWAINEIRIKANQSRMVMKKENNNGILAGYSFRPGT